MKECIETHAADAGCVMPEKPEGEEAPATLAKVKCTHEESEEGEKKGCPPPKDGEKPAEGGEEPPAQTLA